MAPASSGLMQEAWREGGKEEGRHDRQAASFAWIYHKQIHRRRLEQKRQIRFKPSGRPVKTIAGVGCEGWIAWPGRVCDGGWSGGTMARPDLTKLSRIDKGRVDYVVV